MENPPKIQKTITKRKNEQLIVDDIYLFNLHKTNKDKSKYFQHIEYKTLSKYPGFIKLNDKEEIIKFDNKHNHNDSENKTYQEEGRKKLQTEIKNNSDPFSIKIHKLYNSYSADRGIKLPSYSTIKSTLYNEINKMFPKDIISFESAPNESLYYNILNNSKILLHKQNTEAHYFLDSTFYSFPSFAYQLFITRIFDKNYNAFYTTSFSLMKGKYKEDYLKVFKKIDNHVKQFLPINKIYKITELHSDFEIGIGSADKTIYKDLVIKFWIWHQRRVIENKKNSLCKSDILNDVELYKLYNVCCNLFLCDPLYVQAVFDVIKLKIINENFKGFLVYYEDEYIKLHKIENWNYYQDYIYITNNACEAYNSKLNKLLYKKPTYFKLIYELRIEEANIINIYNKRYSGLMGHEYWRKRIIEEIIDILNDNIEVISDLPNRMRLEKKKIALKWWLECLQRIRFSNL